MSGGMPAELVLFYRFLFATMALGLLLVVRHERLHARTVDLAKMAGMSFMYSCSALLLFWSFAYVPSGVATTLQFLYPVMVMLIMTVFFHEKFSWITFMAIVLAISGVALLSGGDGEKPVRALGVVMLLVSALTNGIYIAGIHVARIHYLSGLAVTFYVMLFSAVFTFFNAHISGHFRLIADVRELGLLFLLSMITAVLSNLTLVLAVQRIGSTLTSVLGAMEPLTAVAVGIAVFHEPFTSRLMGGVVLIVGAVMSVMLGPQLTQVLRRFRKPARV